MQHLCLQFWKVKQVQGKGIHCWNWENFYHSKITVLHSIKCTCSFKNVNANIPKIWGFSREKLKISKEAQDFHMYRDHFCYLSLNFLINIFFVIHDEILSWFLDQFYKRQIALVSPTISGHYSQLRFIFCAKHACISVHLKSIFDSHICIETFEKGFGFFWKRSCNY